MQKIRGFSLRIAGLAAVALFVGTSAFADGRHLGRTGGSSHGPRMSSRSTPRFSGRAPAAPRFGSRGPAGPFRGPGYYNSGRRFYGQGRIERIVPYHGGYRLYLGGWGYPFFVPYNYWDPFRFRVGLFIGLNAFYDPLGYYSVYGWPPAPYYSYRGYRDDSYDSYDSYDNDSVVRGVVESIDLHSGYVTIDEDRTHRTITAMLPPRDNRVDGIRIGDYVEFSGEWNRDYFDAAHMDRFEPRQR